MSKHPPRFEFHKDTRRIHQRPTTTKNDDGSSSMSLGFPVCTVEQFITKPEGVLELMNKGDRFGDLLEALEEIADANVDLVEAEMFIQVFQSTARAALAKGEQPPAEEKPQ